MTSHHTKIALLLLIASFFIGCASPQQAQLEGTANELRVGVSPDYPPIIFERNGAITGVEADLARQLAKELKRPIRFVKLNWEDQITALTNGRTDIIMSGMSVTKAREVRVVFAEPYLKSGLIAAMRAEDAKKYNSKESILNGFVAVGAVQDTTGDAFVRRNFPNGVRKTFLPTPEDGAHELKRMSIDIFVNDAPSVIWLVSENEADITGFWEPLTEEYLAWAVRKGDERLLMDVNAALQRWKEDGTLVEILKKWLPEQYLKRMPLNAR